VANLDRQIRYFVRIAELKSRSKATDSLDLTQSGLSRRLAALETHLVKPLFSRTGRGVELTDAGRVLLDAAKSAYRLVDGALEAVREKEGVVQGNLRLATVHTLSSYSTADVISAFVAGRPRVNVSLNGPQLSGSRGTGAKRQGRYRLRL
jgi:LysR family transcriptional regulator, transcription activator of glutamate synthase operon